MGSVRTEVRTYEVIMSKISLKISTFIISFMINLWNKKKQFQRHIFFEKVNVEYIKSQCVFWKTCSMSQLNKWCFMNFLLLFRKKLQKYLLFIFYLGIKMHICIKNYENFVIKWNKYESAPSSPMYVYTNIFCHVCHALSASSLRRTI